MSRFVPSVEQITNRERSTHDIIAHALARSRGHGPDFKNLQQIHDFTMYAIKHQSFEKI